MAAQAAVYLRAGDALSAAGRGVDALADACLRQSTVAAEVRFASLGAEVRLPYFRVAGGQPSPAEALHAVALAALDAADLPPARRRRTGVFLGTSSGGIAGHERSYCERHAQDRDALPIYAPDQSKPTTALHASLDLAGPSYTFGTACSSAANALLYASWMLRENRLDDALVVGVEIENRLSQQGFNSLLLATRALSRPFDRRRDGIMLGECVAAVLLSREPPAQGPRWRIRGGGTLCDASHPTNPSSAQIARTIELALRDAGVEAASISAIKAHGTGTRANDLSEGLGLRQVFGERVPPFTTLKPVLGHTLGACGVLETLAFTACLDRGALPATRYFEQPDPEIGLEPLTRNAGWSSGPVLVNTFGFGGNNCSLVLERES